MGLSRKHYIKVAEILNWRIKSTRNNTASDGLEITNKIIDVIHTTTNDLAEYFQEDNPNFDRQRFLNAVQGSD